MNTQILTFFHLKYQPANTILLLLGCARGSVCVCMTVVVWWVGMRVCGGEQISFEQLIWNKVAQEGSRAVILFPNVCDQHL